MSPAAFLSRKAWRERRCRSFGTSWWRRISAVATFFLALLATGCASQHLDAETAKSIKRIALAGPENPSRYALYDTDIGMALMTGLAVNPGAAAGIGPTPTESTRQDATLTEAMASQNLHLGDEMRVAIADALRQLGFNVIQADIARKRPSKMLESYKGLAVDADVLLDVSIEKCAYTRRLLFDFGPSLIINARLVEVQSAKELFLKMYLYNMHVTNWGFVNLRPPERFGFGSPKEVLAHPELAAEGFRAVIPMIVDDLRTGFAKAR